MKWSPKIVYNAITLTFTTSQKPWIPKSKGIGGFGVSGAGVPESFTQRRDEMLTMVLRFYESELNAVMSWIAWAQDNAGSTFDLYLDAADVTPVVVYLIDPTIGEDVQPIRNPQYPKQFEITVTVKTANGSRFTRAYF